jgi:hypothetical protein
MKKVWVNDKDAVAVYKASSSGEPQMSIVNRYMQGLKQKDAATMKLRGLYKDSYNKANGPNSFANFEEQYRKAVHRQWSELLSFREDLSSK